ncbi:acyltransferase domain-containing protein, partial [Streptomyces malaysiensis]|uniref:acyltransferase domain-containing protein n=1 Tax=Streptomyces malaysiensis TaxID=92644 RepID=UPI0033FC1FA9
RTLHVDEPSSQVDWASGDVRLLTEARDWSGVSRPRRAGVSSFGISGTNAHVILEQAPEPESADSTVSVPMADVPVVPWVVSGRSASVLRAQAARLAAYVAERSELSLVDAAHALMAGRSGLEHRAVVVAGDRAGLLAGLESVALGDPDGRVVVGGVGSGKVGLVFSGQGSQRVGMGLELADAYPVFAEALDEVCAEIDPLLGVSLREVLAAGEGVLDRTVFTQAGLFAVEVALFRLVESWGVRADALLGHSIGEVAAAHVAGVFSLADACRLVAARGRLMQALPEGGAMVAIAAAEAEVAKSLEGYEGVSIAAVNSPSSAVVSGDEDAALEVAGQWAGRGRKTRRLPVSHAFHSSRMEPMLEEFRQVAESIAYSLPRIPVVSNVTGDIASQELCSPAYWVTHVRETVRFADGVKCLRERGVTRFVELGPDGALTPLVHECLDGDETAAMVVPMLRKDRPESESAVLALGHLYASGGEVDWRALLPGRRQHVDLPTYAFQHQRYWLDAGVPSHLSGADSPFWEAVRSEDVASLADMLDVDQEALAMVLPGLASWWERRDTESKTTRNGDDTVADEVVSVRERLDGLPVEDRREALLDLVTRQAAVVLGHTSHGDVGPDADFLEMGFGSLTAVEFRNRLNAAMEIDLPSTLVYDYPTPAAVVGLIAEQV